MEPDLPENTRIDWHPDIQWVEIQTHEFEQLGVEFGAFVCPNGRSPTRKNQEWCLCSDILVKNDDGKWVVQNLSSDELAEVIEWEAFIQFKGIVV